MKNSILLTIKKLLGIAPEYDCFDTDIIININYAIATLDQLGYPANGFTVTNARDSWDDYLEDDASLELIKTYIYLKVKMVFDPPTSGMVMDSYKGIISELEWRINSLVDYEREEDEEEDE